MTEENQARQILTELIKAGMNTVHSSFQAKDIHAIEKLEKIAIGYYVAITSILHPFPELFNEFIEKPELVILRRIQRRYI